jgi:hypothetical protein
MNRASMPPGFSMFFALARSASFLEESQQIQKDREDKDSMRVRVLPDSLLLTDSQGTRRRARDGAATEWGAGR